MNVDLHETEINKIAQECDRLYSEWKNDGGSTLAQYIRDDYLNSFGKQGADALVEELYSACNEFSNRLKYAQEENLSPNYIIKTQIISTMDDNKMTPLQRYKFLSSLYNLFHDPIQGNIKDVDLGKNGTDNYKEHIEMDENIPSEYDIETLMAETLEAVENSFATPNHEMMVDLFCKTTKGENSEAIVDYLQKKIENPLDDRVLKSYATYKIIRKGGVEGVQAFSPKIIAYQTSALNETSQEISNISEDDNRVSLAARIIGGIAGVAAACVVGVMGYLLVVGTLNLTGILGMMAVAHPILAAGILAFGTAQAIAFGFGFFAYAILATGWTAEKIQKLVNKHSLEKTQRLNLVCDEYQELSNNVLINQLPSTC